MTAQPCQGHIQHILPVDIQLLPSKSTDNWPIYSLVFQRISTTPQVVGRVIVDEPRPMGITLGRPSIESSSSIGTIKSKTFTPAIPMQENKEFSSIFNCS
nr:hypothetical protein Iba_chr09bCG8800 [Ipomoea batatas]